MTLVNREGIEEEDVGSGVGGQVLNYQFLGLERREKNRGQISTFDIAISKTEHWPTQKSWGAKS